MVPFAAQELTWQLQNAVRASMSIDLLARNITDINHAKRCSKMYALTCIYMYMYKIYMYTPAGYSYCIYR